MIKRLLVFIVLVAALLSGCNSFTAVNPCDVEMGSHQLVSPATKGHNWWMPRHEAVIQRNAEGNVNIIFIGDSITHHWENNGKEFWAKYYEPRGAVNMGFSGDGTQNVLWRLENGEIDGINPKVAVIMIGTNNSNGDTHTVEQIADGINAIVCKLRTELPQTKVVILGIFPRGSKEQMQDKQSDATHNYQWAKLDSVNELISKTADNKMVYYLNINDKFLDEQGTLTREIMPDLLHLSEKGYQIWAEALEPTLEKLMK